MAHEWQPSESEFLFEELVQNSGVYCYGCGKPVAKAEVSHNDVRIEEWGGYWVMIVGSCKKCAGKA